jgi:uncharacterized protein (DUF58 family)
VSLLARLLDAEALGRYDALGLHVRRGMGDRLGDRRFPGSPQPAGTEIEAYAAYTPGDDLRHLDWHALGRLDTLLIRRFTAEREVLVHLLLDGSASMRVPAADGKLEHALELAMALGYLALGSNDAVRAAVLASGPTRLSPTLRQRPSAVRLADFLAAVAPAGRGDLGAALGDYARAHRRPGLALVISDFMMDPAGVEPGVTALAARGYEIHLLHVIGAAELDPTRELASGVLQDVESGMTHPMTVTAASLARYQALLAAHLAALAALAERTGAGYARLATDGGVRDFIAGELPRLGLVRRR